VSPSFCSQISSWSVLLDEVDEVVAAVDRVAEHEGVADHQHAPRALGLRAREVRVAAQAERVDREGDRVLARALARRLVAAFHPAEVAVGLVDGDDRLRQRHGQNAQAGLEQQHEDHQRDDPAEEDRERTPALHDSIPTTVSPSWRSANFVRCRTFFASFGTM
jgi:hypothetical protein